MKSNNMTQRLKAARFMTQRPETARIRPKAAQIKRYRRFHGYDYSRGASIFVTFAVKGRLPLFGQVEGGKVDLSPAGKAAFEAILFENRRPGRRVWAASFVVMPDHVHLRLVLEPDSLLVSGDLTIKRKDMIRTLKKHTYETSLLRK